METQTITSSDPKLAELVRRLVEAVHPERIYLFGSRALGAATDESDYDVVMLVSQGEDQLYDLEVEAYRALQGFGEPVDVVAMNRDFYERRRVVIASLAGTVAREGKLLYAA